MLKASKYNGKNFENIFGNDFDMNVLRLSYINMLLHNDGITNLVQKDAREEEFAKWVKSNHITKILANPPYEQAFAIEILMNVLKNVEKGCKVVWLMPNNKFNTKLTKKSRKEFLAKHTLTDIIFLGDIFPKTGCGDVSLFLITANLPQGETLTKGWHLDDGFVTVKNQGYQDIKGTWPKIEQDFLDKFSKNEFDKIIDLSSNLSYEKDVEISMPTAQDYQKVVMLYNLYKNGTISSQNTVESVIDLILFTSNKIDDVIPKSKPINYDNWKEFKLTGKGGLFKSAHGTRITKANSIDGNLPLITAGNMNNGVNRYIQKPEKNTIYKKAITIDMFGSVFYQDKEFVCDDNIYPVFPIQNEYVGLFIVPIIKKQLNNSFAKQFRLKYLEKIKIKLPVTQSGEPDWEYMETYIRSI